MKIGLSVENLNCYNLSNINFSVDKNTFTALMGKNGSGKTLLLKCIAGLLDHTGNITIDGNVIIKSPILNKSVGIYLGTVNLSNDNVFSNILEPLINFGFSVEKAKKKVYEISKKLGIDKLLYKDIDDLSFIEKRIVAFTKSIVHCPNILLLDNIFDGLDTYYKNIVIDYLKSKKDLIVIFTTNDCENLMLSDNIIILNKGKIVVNENSKELFNNEQVFSKNKLKTPFVIDLSNKLKTYELIDNIVYDIPDIAEELWN